MLNANRLYRNSNFLKSTFIRVVYKKILNIDLSNVCNFIRREHVINTHLFIKAKKYTLLYNNYT